MVPQVREFGVELEEGAGDECAAALALLLFGDTVAELPGGYSTAELSDSSPLKQVKKFPQELVMLGRATVLLKVRRRDGPAHYPTDWTTGPACCLQGLTDKRAAPPACLLSACLRACLPACLPPSLSCAVSRASRRGCRCRGI